MLKKKLLTIIAILCVLICVALSIVFLDRVETYKFSEDAIYYVNGIDYIIPTNTVAKIDTNENINITLDDGDSVDVSTLPAYCNNKKIVTIDKIAYYVPSFDSKFDKYKLKPFTEIEYNADTKFATFTKSNKTVESQRGFLYDGHGTYVFLEDMRISYNDKIINVPALSYAIVENNSWIQLLNYDTKDFVYDDLNSKATAISSDGLYKINMSYSTITYGNNESLMPGNVDILRDLIGGNK